MPTPDTAKQPIKDGIGLAMGVTLLLAAGGLVAPLTVGHVGRTCGAPHSLRLEFEVRDAQIGKAVEEQTGQPAAQQEKRELRREK